ncbi:MAG TPA: hypothetical protein VMW38_25065 [Terriglobia bacterium]|nr:hypothetical protein [Terriglobia bacterium]
MRDIEEVIERMAADGEEAERLEALNSSALASVRALGEISEMVVDSWSVKDTCPFRPLAIQQTNSTEKV